MRTRHAAARSRILADHDRVARPPGIGHDRAVDTRKVGVEEELMLVDPATGRLTAVASRALRAHEQDGRDDAPLEAELFLQQIESQTPPTTDVTEIAAQLRPSRRVMGEAAARPAPRPSPPARPCWSTATRR